MNHLLLPHTHLCCVGDIHGEFEGLPAWFLKYDLQDTCIVFCGDIGLGFESEAYYEQLFPKLNRECKKRHLSLIFVRGNHDDPSYFICRKINLSNIKAVPDYTILSVAGHPIKVWCYGHYHFHNVMEHNGIDFRLLDMSYHNSNYDSFELN